MHKKLAIMYYNLGILIINIKFLKIKHDSKF